MLSPLPVYLHNINGIMHISEFGLDKAANFSSDEITSHRAKQHVLYILLRSLSQNFI